MMLQRDELHEHVPQRLERRPRDFVIVLHLGRRRQVPCEEAANRRDIVWILDFAPILPIRPFLERIKLINRAHGPDEPQLFRSFFGVKLKAFASLRDQYLLPRRQLG